MSELNQHSEPYTFTVGGELVCRYEDYLRLEEQLEAAQKGAQDGDEWKAAYELAIENHKEQLETLQREKHELIGVAGSVLWIDNNMHLYGTKEWRGYFKAVVRDARRGYELRDASTPASEPEAAS